MFLREAKKACASSNLIQPFLCEVVNEDGVEMTKVRNTQPIPLPYGNSLPGTWEMHAEWLLRTLPGESRLVVWRSSVGLSVEGTSITPDGQSACLVRYDVDNQRARSGVAPRGRHINVLQPDPLMDHVHYPTFSESQDPWPVRTILELFQSQPFIDDLARRLGST